LVLDNKGRVAQEILPTDPPADTDTGAPVRVAYKSSTLTAEENGAVPERTPPTVLPKYNNALSAPYIDDTPKPVVS
jgi:hypothetical protein